MPHRLLIALTLSLTLHFSLLVADALDFSSPPPARTLQASLRMAPDLTRLPEPPPLPESLLKNTLDAAAINVKKTGYSQAKNNSNGKNSSTEEN